MCQNGPSCVIVLCPAARQQGGGGHPPDCPAWPPSQSRPKPDARFLHVQNRGGGLHGLRPTSSLVAKDKKGPEDPQLLVASAKAPPPPPPSQTPKYITHPSPEISMTSKYACMHIPEPFLAITLSQCFWLFSDDIQFILLSVCQKTCRCCMSVLKAHQCQPLLWGFMHSC